MAATRDEIQGELTRRGQLNLAALFQAGNALRGEDDADNYQIGNNADNAGAIVNALIDGFNGPVANSLAARTILSEVLFPGAPAGHGLPAAIPNLNAVFPAANTHLRAVGEARFARLNIPAERNRLTAITNDPARRDIIINHLSTHPFNLNNFQAALEALDAADPAILGHIKTVIHNHLGVNIVDITDLQARAIKAEARYVTQRAAIADAPVLSGVISDANFRNEIVDFLAVDLTRQINVANIQAAITDPAGVRVALTNHLGLQPVTMDAYGLVLDAAPGDLIRQLRGEARYTRKNTLYPEITQPEAPRLLVTLMRDNRAAVRANIQAHLSVAGNAINIAAIQGAVAQVVGDLGAAGPLIRQALTPVLGIVDDVAIVSNDQALDLRGEARVSQWLNAKLQTLRNDHPVTILLQRHLPALQAHLRQYAGNQGAWNALFDALSNDAHDKNALAVACGALGVVVQPQDTRAIYAENQKMKIARALHNAGLIAAENSFLGIRPGIDVNAFNRFNLVQFNSFITNDFQNPYTSLERFVDIFTQLGIPADQAETISNTIIRERNAFSAQLNQIKSPLWRKFIKEARSEAMAAAVGDARFITLPQALIDRINNIDPTGQNLQWIKGQLNDAAVGNLNLGDQFVDAADAKQAAALRVWPGAVDALASLQNEKLRLNSYAGITNLALRDWLTNTEAAPRTDGAGILATVNALGNRSDLAYGDFVTQFRAIVFVPAVVTVPVPTQEEYNAIRVRAAFLGAADAAGSARYNEERAAITTKINNLRVNLREVQDSLALCFEDDAVQRLLGSANTNNPGRYLSTNQAVLNDELRRFRMLKQGLLTKRDELLSISKQVTDLAGQLPQIADVIPARADETSQLHANLLGRPASVPPAPAVPEVIGLNSHVSRQMNIVQNILAQTTNLINAAEVRLTDLRDSEQRLLAAAPVGTQAVVSLSDTPPILIAPEGTPNPGRYHSVVATKEAALAALINLPVPENAVADGAVAVVEADRNLQASERIIPLPQAADQWVFSGVKDARGQTVGAIAMQHGQREIRFEAYGIPLFSSFAPAFYKLQKWFNLNSMNDVLAKKLAQELIANADRDQASHPERKTVITLNSKKADDAKLIWKYLKALSCPYEIKNLPNMKPSERQELTQQAVQLKQSLEEQAETKRVGIVARALNTPSPRVR